MSHLVLRTFQRKLPDIRNLQKFTVHPLKLHARCCFRHLKLSIPVLVSRILFGFILLCHHAGKKNYFSCAQFWFLWVNNAVKLKICCKFQLIHCYRRIDVLETLRNASAAIFRQSCEVCLAFRECWKKNKQVRQRNVTFTEIRTYSHLSTSCAH